MAIKALRVKENEQGDKVMREYLALPLDSDGMVLPFYRARARELNRIMAHRRLAVAIARGELSS